LNSVKKKFINSKIWNISKPEGGGLLCGVRIAAEKQIMIYAKFAAALQSKIYP